MQLRNREFLLFLFSGGLAALVNIFSRSIFSFFLDFKTSIFYAYILGMITAYILSRKIVFFSKKNLFKSFFYFTIVNFLAIIQTYYISIWTKEIILPYIGINQFIELISHSTGVVFPVFTSYFGHKYISFK